MLRLVRRPSILHAALFALLQMALPSIASATSWFSMSEGGGSLDVARAQPPQVLPSDAGRALSELVAFDGGAFAVYEPPRGTGPQCPVLIHGDDWQPVGVPREGWEDRRIQAAVAVGGALFWGTDFSLMEIVEGRAVPFVEFGDLRHFAVMVPPPVLHYGGVAQLATDGAGNVWAHGSGRAESIVFYTHRDRWLTTYRNKPLPRPYPLGWPWDVPAEVIAGDPSRPGLWTYGPARDGADSVFYCDLALPGDPWEKAFPQPRVAFPRADTAIDFRLTHTRTAVPNGVLRPQLIRPLLAADITGRCWLAEGAEGAATVHVFDGQVFTDVTPPPELLKGSQLRQLVCDNARGELLVATSVAGVLVFDGAKWSEHPLNSVLPTVKDTGMKPVDRMAVSEDSSVWVATASYLLHWTRDDEPQ
ncbi:MAG: hypothetical protein GX616_11930 [Planctomycetes bacterium]|nr:hypothetical protein [Planctomycetota bacterium]